MDAIFKKLALYLDTLPAGYPPTDDGIEQRILEKLFTEKEAELALNLGLANDTKENIAKKAQLPLDEVKTYLEEMAVKGLISVNYLTGSSPTYAISQFVIGFYEDQVDRLDADVAILIERYLFQFLKESTWRQVPQMRTIPVHESIPITSEVLPYEDIETMLRSRSDFSVRNCVCRQEQQVLGKGCDKPMKTCLALDAAARNDIISGKGTRITLDEALNLVIQGRKAGLVLQPSNSQNPAFVCFCCSCCCGVLRNLKLEAEPSRYVVNAFTCHFDEALCINCGSCDAICPMEAIGFHESTVISLNPLRCIGCGLCVDICPVDAVHLVRKPAQEQRSVPRNTFQLYKAILEAKQNLNG